MINYYEQAQKMRQYHMDNVEYHREKVKFYDEEIERMKKEQEEQE